MILASGGACTLFLSTPGEISDACAIEAPAGVCGACIVERCQPLIDACCGDAECAPLLDTVDDCAEEYVDVFDAYLADASVCAPLATLDVEPGGLLKQCIAAGCSEVCGLDEVTTRISGSSCNTNYTNACECTGTGDEPGNLVSCSPPPSGGMCCAYQAYPALETHCSCSWYKCAPTADGCSCSTSSSGSADRCDGLLCCQDDYGSDCRCTDDPLGRCDSIEHVVTSCVATESIDCPDGENRVTSCNVRRDP